MERRIISGARPHSPITDGVAGQRSRRANLVIADWGPTAELLVFPADEPVDRGARFQYHGTIWVITGRRRDSQIMVAQPISH
jgi:hypothetical protein